MVKDVQRFSKYWVVMFGVSLFFEGGGVFGDPSVDITVKDGGVLSNRRGNVAREKLMKNFLGSRWL